MEFRFRFHVKSETQSHDHATIDYINMKYGCHQLNVLSPEF